MVDVDHGVSLAIVILNLWFHGLRGYGVTDPSRCRIGCQCTCSENQGLVDAFDELAGLYFKEGSKAGLVYKKVGMFDWNSGRKCRVREV